MYPTQELVKLPRLGMIKFRGNIMTWHRVCNQFETSVHFRSNMSPGQMFNCLVASVVGKAAGAIHGLQYSDKKYDKAVSLLKKNFGKNDYLSEAHMNQLNNLEPVISFRDLRGLNKFSPEGSSVHKRFLVAGDRHGIGCAMLLPILKRLSHLTCA